MRGDSGSPGPLSYSPARQLRGKTPKREMQGDRFIPSRSAMDLNVALFSLQHDLTKENASQDNSVSISSPMKEDYKRKLAENFLLPGSPRKSKILAFRNRPPVAAAGHENQIRDLYSAQSGTSGQPKKTFRQVSQCSERILDAPELVDDYYLNLLDWSSTNQVAVALGTTVYLWEADKGAIQLLMQTEETDDYVTSVSWAADGRHLAVGLNSCEVQLWDVNRLKQVRRMSGHQARVGSLDWNGPVLSSGGRDSVILNHDVRMREHVVSRLTGHEQEVCGLKWSKSGQQLASGGNDNRLFIWDAAMTSSHANPGVSTTGSAPAGNNWLHRMEDHTAAVKALAWCPFQSNLLASGGGTADRSIKFWNTSTGALLNSIDTHSQVCALQWSTHERELLSSHGYSQNQLCLWKYPSMAKIAELTGHSARVLHMAQSPDGNTVVSAAADETLRFWKVFGSPDKKQKAAKGKGEENPGLALKRMNIR